MTVNSPHQVEIPPMKLVVVGKEPEPIARIGDSRIEQFLDLKDIAPKTRKTYEQQLRWFSDWVGKDWLAIHLNDVRGYKVYLELEKGLKPNSVALALTTLKGFYRWLIKAGYAETNPLEAVEIPQSPEPEGRNLETYQVEQLFKALETRGETKGRDVAILYLLFYCGLRSSEVSSLNVGDYNGVEVLIREAKHDSVGQVPVDTETHEALKAVLRERLYDEAGELTPESPLFVSNSNRNLGQRLGYEGIYKLVQELAKQAGWPEIHPHHGRHTYQLVAGFKSWLKLSGSLLRLGV